MGNLINYTPATVVQTIADIDLPKSINIGGNVYWLEASIDSFSYRHPATEYTLVVFDTPAELHQWLTDLNDRLPVSVRFCPVTNVWPEGEGVTMRFDLAIGISWQVQP